LMVESAPHEAMQTPSGENFRSFTPCMWSWNLAVWDLVLTSQTLTVRSSLPVAISRMSGLKRPVLTQLEWPNNEYWNFRSPTLHTLAVLSCDVLRTY